jgi:hypothetical protein
MTGSAKQSILSLRGEVECFASLAMTLMVRIRLHVLAAHAPGVFRKMLRANDCKMVQVTPS